YHLVAGRAGLLEGKAAFRMKVDSPRDGWAVPTGDAVSHTIYARYEKEGWQFEGDRAARIREEVVWAGMAGKSTEIRLFAGDPGRVLVRPKQRDASLEE